jgi:hypothetical protein
MMDLAYKKASVGETWGAIMMQRSLRMRIMLTGLACLFATSALANYYVVQDLKTKKCWVVDRLPIGDSKITAVGPASFKTRKEAEEGIKHIIVCTIK